MTIDEAIAKQKRALKFKREMWGKSVLREKNEHLLSQAKEHEQLAEWLEELKDYRDKNKMVVRIDCINLEEFKDMAVKLAKEQYNKAIDDFVEKISLEISESLIWGMIADCFKYKNMNDTSDKIVDYVIDTVKETAEQLKAGEVE